MTLQTLDPIETPTPLRVSAKKVTASGCFIFLIAIALGFRIAWAILRPNVLYPDEIFETLEPAHRLAFGYGILSWEWMESVRSWVFPGFLAGIMRITAWTGPGSIGYTNSIIVTLSLLSLSTVWFAFAWSRRACGDLAGVVAAVVCSFHMTLVYFAPKAFYEVFATNLLLPGLYLGVYGERLPRKYRLFFASMLCGFAACIRLQMVPSVLFALAYFCYPRWRERLPWVIAGLALPVTLFGIVDAVTWSYPWESFVNYVQTNLFGYGKASFETSPWYWYLEILAFLLGPAVLFLWKGSRNSPFLAAFTLVFLASHSVIGHKESRFIYPILPLLLTLAAIGAVELVTKGRPFELLNPYRKIGLFASATLILLSPVLILLSPALTKKSPIHPDRYSWFDRNGSLPAYEQLSQDRTLCGVGLYQVKSYLSGGYSRLHQNVPIFRIMQPSDLPQYSPAANALLAPDSALGISKAFRKVKCWYGTCLYKREGGCVVNASNETEQEHLIRELREQNQQIKDAK